jgi:phosphoenolpyruvate carboxykinase (GTP)
MDKENCGKLAQLRNPKLHRFVLDAIELCNPDSVFVCTDSPGDIRYIREGAIKAGEERPLAMDGHTIHFDGYNDQGRDKDQTKYLVPKGIDLGANLNSIGKEEGLAEVRGLLKGSMAGREMLVRFFSLGPANSDFSISGVQLTDSFYVGHSEDLLYRPGYEQFKRLGDSEGFFRVLHSAGRLVNFVSADYQNKRIYIDLEDEIVYSVNTQYAGNTVGFKKLSLRLAISKADREGWLAEHMLIMGIHGPNGRATYFTGGFPSFCGKTSTAMIPGETIVGDDLAYLRARDGRAYTANVESGIFGIIQDVNPKDDPDIWKALTTPGEVIFSNVLVKDGVPYWLGDRRQHPEKGVNFSGEWHRDKKDADGNPIPAAHKNARYTVRLSALRNRDERADDPEGVPVGGIVYGGRDSDTWIPVQQSFDWVHGVITMGASLESETTAATLGKEGVRSFQPMSNLDFVAIPLGRYIRNHLDFGARLKAPPPIFAVNYFLKDTEGKYLNGMTDKYVWIKWMELRANGDVKAIRGPGGLLPIYEDLRQLFQRVLQKDYSREDYSEQFRLRIPQDLSKLQRIEKAWSAEADVPPVLFSVLKAQRQRLETLRKQKGDYVSPFDL